MISSVVDMFTNRARIGAQFSGRKMKERRIVANDERETKLCIKVSVFLEYGWSPGTALFWWPSVSDDSGNEVGEKVVVKVSYVFVLTVIVDIGPAGDSCMGNRSSPFSSNAVFDSMTVWLSSPWLSLTW